MLSALLLLTVIAAVFIGFYSWLVDDLPNLVQRPEETDLRTAHGMGPWTAEQRGGSGLPAQHTAVETSAGSTGKER